MIVVNGKPISLNGKFFEYKEQSPEYITAHFPLTALGGEYGWLIPKSVIENIPNNDLRIYLSAQTNVPDSDRWESPFYMSYPYNTGNYSRVGNYGDNNCPSAIPGGVTGDREEYVDHSLLESWYNNNTTWVSDCTADNLFSHPAAFQTDKFIEEPYAEFIYKG